MEQNLREKLKFPHFVKKGSCLDAGMVSTKNTGYIVMTLLLARLAFCNIYSNVIPLLTQVSTVQLKYYLSLREFGRITA